MSRISSQYPPAPGLTSAAFPLPAEGELSRVALVLLTGALLLAAAVIVHVIVPFECTFNDGPPSCAASLHASPP